MCKMKTARYDIQHLTMRVVDEERTRVFYEKVLGLVDVSSDENHIDYAFREGEALYINDFEGNGLELYHDRDAAGWQWTDGQVKMGTDEVDADALLAKKTHEWSGFPVGMKIGHLHFMGNDLDVADHFFLDFLQMDLVTDMRPGASFYSNNHYHHHHAVNLWQSRHSDRRHLDEAGLVGWQVIVDEKYFALLTQRAEQMPGLIENSHAQIVIVDPMGSTLTINHE